MFIKSWLILLMKQQHREAHSLFLILETRVQCQLLREDAEASCNTQPTVSNKQNRHFRQNFVLSAFDDLYLS